MSTKLSVTPPAPVSVIGLGNMGVPMALCLAKAGFQVTGYDVSEVSRQRFLAVGGRAATSVADAVKSADVVITLLPDGKVVQTALESLRNDVKPGCILIDMSSSDPLGTRTIGESYIAAGFGFIDAPVSGGVKR